MASGAEHHWQGSDAFCNTIACDAEVGLAPVLTWSTLNIHLEYMRYMPYFYKQERMYFHFDTSRRMAVLGQYVFLQNCKYYP